MGNAWHSTITWMEEPWVPSMCTHRPQGHWAVQSGPSLGTRVASGRWLRSPYRVPANFRLTASLIVLYTELFSAHVNFALLHLHNVSPSLELALTKLCKKKDIWDIRIHLVLNSTADNKGENKTRAKFLPVYSILLYYNLSDYDADTVYESIQGHWLSDN